MLTATLAITAITFAVTVLHMRSERDIHSISIGELWKIRSYQEDDARKNLAG